MSVGWLVGRRVLNPKLHIHAPIGALVESLLKKKHTYETKSLKFANNVLVISNSSQEDIAGSMRGCKEVRDEVNF